MSPGGQASGFHIRETLDAAVRNLVVSSSPLQERVRAARIIIVDRLSPTDFADSEDRELFDQIAAALAAAPSAGNIAGPSAVADQMSDATAEGIASDILDLRDMAMGRAIRNARMTRQRESERGSRR